MKRLRFCLLVAVLGFASCGYRVLDPGVGGGRNMAVPVSRNDTRWRGAEAELTRSLRSEVERLLDVRVGGSPAAWTLYTEIADIRREVPVRDRSGAALLGLVAVEVRWSLENAFGDRLGEGSLQRTLEYLPSENEDDDEAVAELLDLMAEFVVIEVAFRLQGGEPPQDQS